MDKREISSEWINGNRLTTLLNALHVAAERFDADAKEFRDGFAKWQAMTAEDKAKASFAIVHPQAYPGFADQFERQAAETRELHALIQGDDAEDDDELELILSVWREPAHAMSRP
jgi:hypothetical protein